MPRHLLTIRALHFKLTVAAGAAPNVHVPGGRFEAQQLAVTPSKMEGEESTSTANDEMWMTSTTTTEEPDSEEEDTTTTLATTASEMVAVEAREATPMDSTKGEDVEEVAGASAERVRSEVCLQGNLPAHEILDLDVVQDFNHLFLCCPLSRQR